jgi:putative exporter of polyketide antibiotics
MIAFILLFFFFVLAIVLAGVAYSANNRQHAGVAELPRQNARRSPSNRTSTQN